MKNREMIRGLAEGLLELLDETEGKDTAPADTGTPWIDVAREYEGLEEEHDNEKLSAFLGIDPEETSWCAAFANKCLETAGLEGTGSLRARDFAGYGEECECKDGAIAVFRKHVGFVVQGGEKLLGGNQGNSVKESNLPWYHNNMEFLGYRWPSA